MKERIIFSLITSLAMVLMVSCTKAIIEEADTTILPPIQRTVTYKSDVEAIMFNNCVTCHSGAGASAGADLTNYINVKYYAENGVLLQRMNSATNPMPPSGLLQADKRQIIEKWIEDGLLNDK